ncbi:MAG: InlB B-repeat-containing protein, partial [Actinomycetota bacterium]
MAPIPAMRRSRRPFGSFGGAQAGDDAGRRPGFELAGTKCGGGILGFGGRFHAPRFDAALAQKVFWHFPLVSRVWLIGGVHLTNRQFIANCGHRLPAENGGSLPCGSPQTNPMNPIPSQSIRSGSLRGILHAIALALPVAILAALTAFAAGDTTIYSDTLLGSGSALHGTTVDFSATHAGGTAGAIWTAADSYNETATGTIGTSTTTQGAYPPLTPQAGHVYTLTATLEYLGAVPSNWAALGFQTQADVAQGAFHDASGAAYAWTLLRKAGGGQPQFFGGPDTASGGGFATTSEAGLQTVTITLDTTGASWTSHATINGLDSATVTYGTNPTDIRYVGFGGVGTTSNTTNFSLTTNANISSRTLTYSAGANGSISGTTPQTVAYGADGVEVTAVPDSGYHFVNWSDGVLTASRTDLAVTTDITVTANFNSNTHTLTYSAGANGSITGTTPQTVADGTDGIEVTAVADSGYQFVDWSDGVLTASRTDLAVTTDITV